MSNPFIVEGKTLVFEKSGNQILAIGTAPEDIKRLEQPMITNERALFAMLNHAGFDMFGKASAVPSENGTVWTYERAKIPALFLPEIDESSLSAIERRQRRNRRQNSDERAMQARVERNWRRRVGV